MFNCLYICTVDLKWYTDVFKTSEDVGSQTIVCPTLHDVVKSLSSVYTPVISAQ